MTRPEFFDRAACRGMDPNIFVPARGDTHNTAIAKQVCATCPVMEPCRQYGLESHQHNDECGILGGLTRIERVRIMRDNGVARQRTSPLKATYRLTTGAVECGTLSAYQRHVRRKETPCEPCRKANREYFAEYRRRNGRPRRRAA